MFIKDICNKESLLINDSQIEHLLEVYNSDIRSMINYIQLNKEDTSKDNYILSNKVLDDLHLRLTTNSSVNSIINFIHDISVNYNTDKKTIIKKYLNYVIRNQKSEINHSFLNICESVLHINDSDIQNVLKYMILKLQNQYNKN